MLFSRIVWLTPLFCACDAGSPTPPRYELSGNALQPEYLTDYEPRASDVAFFLSRGYERPQLVAVTLDRTDSERYPNLREWKETFGGIAVDNDVKSVNLGRWRTRFHARLHEPEVPDRKRLLPEAVARAKGNVGASAHGRLVYLPRFAQRNVKDGASDNAEDYVLVIDGYNLVYEFSADEIVQVDAYTGSVERIDRLVY